MEKQTSENIMKNAFMTQKNTDNHVQTNTILHNGIPEKMLAACVVSCIMGIVIMALASHYLLMMVFIIVLFLSIIDIPLYNSGKISITTACLLPILILCFVYTPISWFTYNGLLGPTPYLSILFVIMILLTYYKKKQILLLSLYGALMAVLIVVWMLNLPENTNLDIIGSIITAYVITLTLSVTVIEGVKKKNRAFTEYITELSLHDDLTTLLNRRAADTILSRQESAFQKEHIDYTVVMLDIDQFKLINDRYGHNLGDSILRDVAETIRRSIRANDYAFRYGGDEFLFVLVNVNKEASREICLRLEMNFSKFEGYSFPVAVSMGCARRSECEKIQEVLELADRRMYERKRGKLTEEKITND